MGRPAFDRNCIHSAEPYNILLAMVLLLGMPRSVCSHCLAGSHGLIQPAGDLSSSAFQCFGKSWEIRASLISTEAADWLKWKQAITTQCFTSSSPHPQASHEAQKQHSHYEPYTTSPQAQVSPTQIAFQFDFPLIFFQHNHPKHRFVLLPKPTNHRVLILSLFAETGSFPFHLPDEYQLICSFWL